MERKIELKSVFTAFDKVEELNETDRDLVAAARKAAADAYAPYSEFQVGAVLRLEDGTLIHGNNQENASYSLGLCAERVALFAAGANHPGKKIVAMAITAHSPNFEINRPIAPCGACRQAIAEYEHRYRQPIRLILTGEKGEILVAESIEGLLPLQFTADDLTSK
ncbi:MAG: cytidine deaminase [Bacteroidota bacterium]|jgi:cytidine deaminase